jgi:hypothetical protein
LNHDGTTVTTKDEWVMDFYVVFFVPSWFYLYPDFGE